MPTPLPPSVQETLGDPAAGDFARWLETYVEERAVVRDEYREVLTRLDEIGRASCRETPARRQ